MAETTAPDTSHDLQPRRLIVPDQEERDDYAALNTLAQEVEQRITEAIDWYLRKKRWPSRASRLLRFLAIVLAGEFWGGNFGDGNFGDSIPNLKRRRGNMF